MLAERHPDRPLKANVEFYTACCSELPAVPRTSFSPMFAASTRRRLVRARGRTASGWTVDQACFKILGPVRRLPCGDD
jgi:hypothetical protein